MKVLHVSAYFAPAFRYGGPPRTILGLCQAQVRAGVDVEVFTTTANGDAPLPPAPDGAEYEGVRVRYFSLSWPQRFWRSTDLARAMAREASGADLIHVHGLWNFTAWAGARAARAAGVPYVISPRGMLLPGARARHGAAKSIAWWGIQRRDLIGAALLHATSDTEARGLEGFGPPVATIANGVDSKIATPAQIARLRQRLDLPADADVIAFIGRLHPIKRLDLLAGAFTHLRGRGRRAYLVIAGPDEDGFRQRIEPLFHAVTDAVRWTGAIDGDDKWSLLGASRALVQCSDSESFGLSVAEALACGVPVVVTDRGAWAGVTSAGCGEVVTHDAVAIGDALERLIANPESARQMGQRGRDWVKRAFGWDANARVMMREYESIVGRPRLAAAR